MKNKLVFLSVAIICFFVPCFVRAATINAASCSLADVQAAVNSAVDGDTVSVPAGNCTWASTLTIPSALSVSIIGAGIDNTYIAISGAKTFNIRPNQGEFVRISNMELLCGVEILAGSGGVTTKVQDGFRVDHIKIDQTTRGSVTCGRGGKLGNQESWTYGVFDHIEFYHPGAIGVLSGTPQRTDLPFGLGPWLEDAGWGGKDFIYLEDSIIHNTYGGNLYTVGSFDGRYGWKIVIRHNDMLDVNWGGHDMHTTNSHSLRAMEIYDNTWRLSSSNGEALSWNGGAGTRGGSYTVFNNRLSTSRVQDLGNGQPLLITYYRSNGNALGAWGSCDSIQEKFCVGPNNPAPHPFTGMNTGAGIVCVSDSECGAGNHCVPVDSQTETNGYVCREQPGTGKIDSITGVHVLDPAYEWNNLWCKDNAGGLCTPNMDLDWRINNIAQIVLGRDVFDDTPRPGYTPYTYPHPLTVLGGSQPPVDTTAPSIPTNLAATAVSTAQINLSWTVSTDSVGVTGYRVYRGGTQIATSATNSYSDTGLSASTTYTYTVATYDAAGNVSNQSGSASATTQAPADTTPPVCSNGSPTSQLAVNTTQTNLSLTTDENATCRYSISTGTTYASMTNTFSTTGNSSHSTAVSGLQNGQIYTYYVKCIDSAGNANSDDYAISFSVASPPASDTNAPSAPASPVATVVSSSQINLSWVASTDNVGVTGYRVYREGVQVATTTTNSYSDTELSASTTYTYAIAAYDAAGNISGQSSQVLAATRAASTPTSPTTQTGTSTQTGSSAQTGASTQTNISSSTNTSTTTPTTTSSAAETNVSSAANPLMRGSDDTKVYEIINNLRHWIPNPQTFNAYGFDWNKVSAVNLSEVNKYSRAKLLRAQGDVKVYYLTESGLVRHIPNPEVFNSYNNNWNEILTVSQIEIDFYPISNLIRLEGGTKVYKLENNKKRWIITAEAFNRLKYDWTKIAPVNQTELNYYSEGAEIK
jgi:chitodextrinase